MSHDNPVEWIDYIYIEDKDSKTIPIKILTGEYNNVIFTFGTLSITMKQDYPIIKFTFNVLSPKQKKKLLGKDKKFKEYISRILNNILYTEVMDEDRESYIEIPSERQRVRTKDSTLS